MFGGSPAPASAAISPVSSGGNSFGTPSAAKPVQNMFGGNIAGNATASAAPSIFGGASPPQNSFGAQPFGSANTTSTTNLFGGATTTSSKLLSFFDEKYILIKLRS